MNLTIDECFELDGDYQNQFLGIEVFPEPRYNKMKLSERSVNQIHYKDIYILEPLHYYYVTLNEKIEENLSIKINKSFYKNGLIMSSFVENKIFLFNASQNIIYLQKGVKIGEVF